MEQIEETLRGGLGLLCADSMLSSGAAMLYRVQLCDGPGQGSASPAASGKFASAVTPKRKGSGCSSMNFHPMIRRRPTTKRAHLITDVSLPLSYRCITPVNLHLIR